MDPAEELCKKLISWLQLRKRCADQLQMLAKELDNIQDGVRVTKLVGSTMAVTGSLAVLGAGLLTVCTGGLGAPALAMASGGLVGAATGTATSAIASLVDELVSSNKMKKAQGMLEEDKNLGNDIQNLLEELKQMSGSTDPKEQEIELSMHIMRGFAKMRNLNFSDSLLYALLVPEGLRIGINSNVEAICFNTSLKGLMFGIAMTGLKTTAKGMSKVVLAGGAIGLVFSLPELVQTSMELAKGDISESVKTLQDAAYNIREAVSEMERNINNIQQVLEEISQVCHAIKSLEHYSDHVDSNGRVIIDYAKKYSTDPDLSSWLEDSKNHSVYVNHVLLFLSYFQQLKLGEEIKEKKKKKKKKGHIHIVFVAHGYTTPHFMSPASLLPRAIDDVILYSPWNCIINAEVAYGIASGKIRPQDRAFEFTEKDENGKVVRSHDLEPHEALTPPKTLPPDWNRMREANGKRIPSIYVAPVRSEERLDDSFVNLLMQGGIAEKDRLIYRYIIPDTVRGENRSKFFPKVPFYVVTHALSLILSIIDCTATVHLAACLRFSDQEQVNNVVLEQSATQYACVWKHESNERIRMLYNDIDASLSNLIHEVFGHMFQFPDENQSDENQSD